MMSRAQTDDDAPLAEINVTPFVDVMLVLFVIFLVIAPLTMKMLPIELPKVSATASAAQNPSIDIQLDVKNHILVDGKPVEAARLEQAVHELAAATPNISVNLRADRRVPFDQVAHTLASLSQAGIARLSIVSADFAANGE